MPEKTRNAIGPRIRELRHEKNMTLDQLASQVGISASHLSRLERCQTSPSFTVAAAIARELGVTADDLVQIQRQQIDADEQLVNALTSRGVRPITALHIRDQISTSARRELLQALKQGNCER